jgi:sugar (pentulose or hexulose) kinase
MGATASYLAIDFGASSGRAALGSLENCKLTLREVHRFPNTALELPTGLHWDAPRLFHEIKHAMALAVRSGVTLSGVGVDTWGVDYALLTQSGELLGPPHHYRDPRTHGMMAEAFRRMSRDAMYARTGLQDLPFNTLYQLLADQHAPDRPLDRAESLLFMPDLFHYWLTGVRRTEHTIASTSQLYDPGSGTWADDVLKAMALPKRLLPSIAEPGTPVGELRSDIAGEVGARDVTVIAPAGHDTAFAVAAIPAAGNDWAYISSGTWSLVGRELAAPLRSPEALAANFTNERGVAGTIRFHKNITGLWLLQECQREWAGQGRSHSFEQLCALALQAPGLQPSWTPITHRSPSSAICHHESGTTAVEPCSRSPSQRVNWCGASSKASRSSLASWSMRWKR